MLQDYSDDEDDDDEDDQRPRAYLGVGGPLSKWVKINTKNQLYIDIDIWKSPLAYGIIGVIVIYIWYTTKWDAHPTKDA